MSSKIEQLHQQLKKRILVLDGGMGTMIQGYRLSEDDFRGIAGIMLGEVGAVLSERGISFIWDESLVEMLVKEAYSVTYGARELRRIIQKKIEDPLAEEMVKPRENSIRTISISAAGNELIIKIDPEAE